MSLAALSAALPAGLPPDRCPRCGAGFFCGAGAAAACPCGSLQLGAELLAMLRQRYPGCLCLACLAALAAAAAPGIAAQSGADNAPP